MSLPSSEQSPAIIDEARWLAEEVKPHESVLRGYLRRNFSTVDADDVVQESYVKMIKAKTSGRITSTRGYLFSVARNTAMTFFRRQQFYSDVPISELPSWRVLDQGRDPAETANAHQQFDLVVAAIGELPGRCREIVTLVAVDGLSYAEVAARLRLSESTVRVQIARGVERIEDYLRKRGER